RPPPPGRFPALLLLAAAPADPDLARRLAVLLLSPRELGIAGVLLGEWPHGPTWRVDPDGTTHPHTRPGAAHLSRWAGGGGRLCMLPAGAAADLLTLQAAARPRRAHLHNPLPPTPAPRRPAGPAAAPALSLPARTGPPTTGNTQVSAGGTGGAGGAPPPGAGPPPPLRPVGPVA